MMRKRRLEIMFLCIKKSFKCLIFVPTMSLESFISMSHLWLRVTGRIQVVEATDRTGERGARGRVT